MFEILLNILKEFWFVLGEMSPFILVGFLISGILHIFISPEIIQKHLGKKGLGSVFKASLFGVPLPLCSCSVIPVTASIKKNGATKGATTSFLISTPQTGIDSILVTFGLLGPILAIIKPISAFINGVIGGYLVDITDKENNSDNNIEDTNCCSAHSPQKKNPIVEIFYYGFVVLLKDLSLPLLIGLIAAGIIAVLIPENFFADILGTGPLSMFIMLFAGIPLYVCATASIPIAAILILKGVTPGAILVFLMTGPATNIATIATTWKILGKKATIIYLISIIVTALIFGTLTDFIFTSTMSTPEAAVEWMIPSFLRDLSAILLLILLAGNIINDYRTAKKPSKCNHK